jgi:hypothetical protein
VNATAAFVDVHYRLVTRALLAHNGPIDVPVGREGNFVARDHNRRGQLAAGDGLFTALCVAHSYGLMHHSEMAAFLSSVHLRAPVATVDLGCGIGSALVAVGGRVGDHAGNRWLAFDPNPHILALAEAVLAQSLGPQVMATRCLDDDALDLMAPPSGPEPRPSVVVVANHIFHQVALTPADNGRLVAWVTRLVERVGSLTFVGVEPERSGLVDTCPLFLAGLAGGVDVDRHVDESRQLPRLETRSTAEEAPFAGVARKRVRHYTFSRRG